MRRPNSGSALSIVRSTTAIDLTTPNRSNDPLCVPLFFGALQNIV
jgi:hypothetical protein